MSYVSTWPSSEPTSSYGGKRALDLALAVTACLLFAPLVAGIAILVWLEDRNSPWFRQARVGRDRRLFIILKLRTLRNHEVTAVGRWLRGTGLDELPQFFNVLRGEMSIVGPRPLTPLDVERLGYHAIKDDWRFTANPGITGLSQLFGGVTARGSRRLDRLYLRRQGMLLDAQLIVLSFAVNMLGKRAIRRWIRGKGR
jgi:undecaprenyl phosphate N,N'-diacetylbacillosamine 1-phosphate transferase